MMKKEVKRPEEEKKSGKPNDLPYNPEVTSEDRQALNAKGKSMNKGQDKDLDRKRETDFTPDELDIPASNDAKPDDKSALVDEENMQYNKKGARPERDISRDHPNSSKKI